jgi:purine-binding chemotaxis protein CheW
LAIEQPDVIPTVVVDEIEQAEVIVVEEPPAVPAPRPDTPPAVPSSRPDPPLPVLKTPADTDEGEKQLVVFTLDGEDYGLDIGSVESIIKLQPITAVPRAHAFIEGITNLRGAVLPVVDLRKRFGMPAGESNKDNRIVVVEMGNTTIGMIVDTVTEVLRVPQKNVTPPSPVVATIDANYITGIAKVDDGPDAPGRLIILLDLNQLLSTKETTNSPN